MRPVIVRCSMHFGTMYLFGITADLSMLGGGDG